jgi:hypothetical protein
LAGLKKVTIGEVLKMDFPKPAEEEQETSRSNKLKCNKCTFSCNSNATLGLHKLFHSDPATYFSEIDSLIKSTNE